jgi:single-stranded-DNA-specific exonuclease
MQKRWEIVRPDQAIVKRIREALAVSTVTATIMANRDIRTAEEAKAFFTPSLGQLAPPFAIRGMQKAVQRLHQAVIGEERILVFGDYDVDGITSTALLYEFLHDIGAQVECYIPHRFHEGYGLQAAQIATVALPKRIDLIVTVDCGSSSHAAVEMANQAGIDIIITDHHQIEANMPSALAVINPKRPDCEAGFETLAGVGVVFCLLICLRKYLRDNDFWRQRPEPNLKSLCDLVALGTVADIVPMTNANRILTKTGVDIMNQRARPGLEALMKMAGIMENQLTADDIAFRLGPRLNAAGRMDHASIAVNLLVTHKMQTAAELAEKLQDLNARRQETEKQIIETIDQRLAQDATLLKPNTLVLSGEGWHEGVLGIIASKLTQKYHRPTVIITEDGQSGFAKGSARSVAGLNLYEILTACKKHLTSFGGHALAAGLKLEIKHMEAFQRRFDRIVSQLVGSTAPIPRVTIDYELYFDDIQPGLIDELEAMAPFGDRNPPPLFLSQNIEVLRASRIAERHLKLRLRQKGSPGKILNAIQFNIDRQAVLPDFFNQIAYRLQWNRWNDHKQIQLIIEEA